MSADETVRPAAGDPPSRLACGADADAVLAQVADGEGDRRTEHQQQCPHCQSALAEYTRLWSAVDALSAMPVRAPDGVIDAVLRSIRTTSADPWRGRLPDADGGATRIAGHVVAVTARLTTDQVPGVRAALSRHTGADDSVRVGVTGGSAALEITLAVDYGPDLHALADRVRDAVADAVRTLTGLEPVEITIVVDDVFPPL